MLGSGKWLEKRKSQHGVDNPGIDPGIWFKMSAEAKKAEDDRFRANKWGMFARPQPVANQKLLKQIGVEVQCTACPATPTGQDRPRPEGDGYYPIGPVAPLVLDIAFTDKMPEKCMRTLVTTTADHTLMPALA